MKKLQLIAVLLLSSLALAAVVRLLGAPYYAATSVSQAIATITPLPNVGHFTGANTIITPIPWSINKIARVTDGNTDPAHIGGSFVTAYSGGDVEHQFSIDDSMFYLGRSGGANHYLYTFDANPMSATYMKSTYVGQMTGQIHAFSGQRSALVYGIIGTSLISEDFSLSLTNPRKRLIYDFAGPGHCLAGQNIVIDQSAEFGGDRTDTWIATDFRGPGQANGSATLTVVYKFGKGCRVFNSGNTTVAGVPPSSVIGDYGPTGRITMSNSKCPGAGAGVCGSDGNGTFPDQFTIHESYPPAGSWMSIAQNSCFNNCTSGANADGPYIWQMDTLNITATQTGGHKCYGNNFIAYGTGTPQGQMAISQVISGGVLTTSPLVILNLASTSAPNNLPSPNAFSLDEHCTWANNDGSDTNYVFTSNTTNNQAAGSYQANNMIDNGMILPNYTGATGSNPMAGPFTNELLGWPVATTIDGAVCSTSPCTTLPIKRINPTFISALSTNFNAQNASFLSSWTGRFLMFVSDWGCQLGDPNNDANSVCPSLLWIPTHNYFTGDVITPNSGNPSAFTYAANGACTSGGAAPTWVSGTVTEAGGCSWNYLGAASGGTLPRWDVFISEVK